MSWQSARKGTVFNMKQTTTKSNKSKVAVNHGKQSKLNSKAAKPIKNIELKSSPTSYLDYNLLHQGYLNYQKEFTISKDHHSSLLKSSKLFKLQTSVLERYIINQIENGG